MAAGAFFYKNIGYVSSFLLIFSLLQTETPVLIFVLIAVSTLPQNRSLPAGTVLAMKGCNAHAREEGNSACIRH